MGQDTRGRLPPPLPKEPLEEEQTDAGATRGTPLSWGGRARHPGGRPGETKAQLGDRPKDAQESGEVSGAHAAGSRPSEEEGACVGPHLGGTGWTGCWGLGSKLAGRHTLLHSLGQKLLTGALRQPTPPIAAPHLLLKGGWQEQPLGFASEKTRNQLGQWQPRGHAEGVSTPHQRPSRAPRPALLWRVQWWAGLVESA